jgi:hypothetical protein
MSVTTSTRTIRTTATPSTRRFARTPVSLVGLGAVVGGSVVTEIFGAVAHAAGVEMVAGSPGATAAQVGPGDYTGGVVFFGLFGVVLACALARWARSPRRTWTVTAWLLTALSLTGPVLAVGATASTHVTLVLSHVVAAAVVVPIVAARLATARGRR